MNVAAEANARHDEAAPRERDFTAGLWAVMARATRR